MAIDITTKISKVTYDGTEIPLKGITPSGTISIFDNETVDVTNYVYASVDVKTGIPITPTYLYFKEISDITLQFSKLIATIYWGDGGVETFNSSDPITISHHYYDGSPNHVVMISPNIQRYIDFGYSDTNLQWSIIFGNYNTLLRRNIFNSTSSNTMSNALVHVKFGSAVDFKPYAFAYCNNLSIDLTKFDNNVAINKNGTKVPRSRVSLSSAGYIFYQSGTNTAALSKNIIISNAVGSISGNTFAQSGYTHIIIERGGHISGNQIILLNSSFSNMSLQKILVPQEMLNYYQTATNWSQYASLMVGY